MQLLRERQSDSCTLLVGRSLSLDLILESVCSLSPAAAAPRNRVSVIHKFMTEGRKGGERRADVMVMMRMMMGRGSGGVRHTGFFL